MKNKKIKIDKSTIVNVALGLFVAGLAMQMLKPITDKATDKVHEIMYKAGV